MKRHTGVATDLSARSVRPGSLRHAYIAAILLLAWLAVPWWMILGTTLLGKVVFVVCALFTLFAFGIAGITLVQALKDQNDHEANTDDEGAVSSGVGPHRVTEVFTGPLPVSAAMVQILLIPAAVAIGFTAFAIVEVVVRA